MNRRPYMVMREIAPEDAMKIAAEKGLKPAKVKGTTHIQFTRGGNDRLEEISWDEFKSILKERGLGIYESGGWMKIMQKK